MRIASKYNLRSLKATEALGTHYVCGKYRANMQVRLVMWVFTFNGNKIITTGGGGMIVSDDEDLLKRAKHLTTQAKNDDFITLMMK